MKKQTNKLVIVICLLYIVIYVVLKAYNNPNLEFFNQGDKLVGINDVLASATLVEINFTRPTLAEDEKMIRYLIYISKDNNQIIQKEITDSLVNIDGEILKHTLFDSRIENNMSYSLIIKGITNTNKEIESLPYSFTANNENQSVIKLNQEIVSEMNKNKNIFIMQESEQNTQNRIISELKKRVDNLRQDIVVLKNKDKTEYRQMEEEQKFLGFPTVQNEMLSGNYNINLNLEE
mgnify:CR=1 FL=1|tara:strand:- start:1508 stop:2209 length:702 start_codon:yes stop_codon:yes gene_type:complete